MLYLFSSLYYHYRVFPSVVISRNENIMHFLWSPYNLIPCLEYQAVPQLVLKLSQPQLFQTELQHARLPLHSKKKTLFSRLIQSHEINSLKHWQLTRLLIIVFFKIKKYILFDFFIIYYDFFVNLSDFFAIPYDFFTNIYK